MKIILCITVLLSIIIAASGLKCYQCNSHLDAACNDPFHEESTAIKNYYLVVCEESPEGLKPFCRKTSTYFERNDEVRLHRDCGYLEREGYECYQKRSEDYVSDVCQCKTNACNSATTFGAAALALIIPFTVAALL